MIVGASVTTPPVQNRHVPLSLQRSAAAADDAVWHPSGQANVSAVARTAKAINTHTTNKRRTRGLCIKCAALGPTV